MRENYTFSVDKRYVQNVTVFNFFYSSRPCGRVFVNGHQQVHKS